MFNRLGIGDTFTKLGTITSGVQDANLKAQLTAVQAEFQTHVQELQTQNDALTANLTQQQTALAAANDKVTTATSQVAQRDAQIADLQKQLSAVTTQVTSASPESIATSFASVVDKLQSQARQAPNGVGTTVRSLQIEVKGIVQVQAGAAPVMMFPAVGAAVDPATYSTLRVEYAAIPALGTPAPPPAPAPAPAPPH